MVNLRYIFIRLYYPYSGCLLFQCAGFHVGYFFCISVLLEEIAIEGPEPELPYFSC